MNIMLPSPSPSPSFSGQQAQHPLQTSLAPLHPTLHPYPFLQAFLPGSVETFWVTPANVFLISAARASTGSLLEM